MNDVIKGLFERKSVRVYSDEMIEEDKKKLIIDAAIQAPTAGNMTLYSIIDVEDQEIKEKLAKVKPKITEKKNSYKKHLSPSFKDF